MDIRVGFGATSELEKIAKDEILNALANQDWPRYTTAIAKYEKLDNYNSQNSITTCQEQTSSIPLRGDVGTNHGNPAFDKYSKIMKRTSEYMLEFGC